MFKRLLVIAAVVLGISSASAEFRWGPTLGMNGSTFHWKQNLAKTTHLIGMQAGLSGELMIPGIGFGIDMGIRYQLHGAHVNFGDHKIWAIDGIKNQNVWTHNLQIPLNLKFKWTRMNGFEQILAPFVYGGPVFGFNLATNKAPAIKYPLGYVCMQVAAGGELFEHYQISAGYSWGVSYQIATIKLDNYSAQPRGWFINLTYLF